MEPKRSSRRGALLWFAAALAVLATALWLRLRGNTAISGPGTPGRYKAEAQCARLPGMLWQRLAGRLRDPPPCARTKKGRPAGGCP